MRRFLPVRPGQPVAHLFRGVPSEPGCSAASWWRCRLHSSGSQSLRGRHLRALLPRWCRGPPVSGALPVPAPRPARPWASTSTRASGILPLRAWLCQSPAASRAAPWWCRGPPTSSGALPVPAPRPASPWATTPPVRRRAWSCQSPAASRAAPWWCRGPSSSALPVPAPRPARPWAPTPGLQRLPHLHEQRACHLGIAQGIALDRDDRLGYRHDHHPWPVRWFG